MADGYPQPVFLDATVLSNVASTDGVTVFASVIDSPVVVPAVRDEIERGCRAGREYLAPAIDAFGEVIPVRDVGTDAEFRELRDRLDPGEAASIVGVLERGGTVATDDLAARRVGEERAIPVTGSIGLLVLAVERERIDRQTADEWLDTWRNQRGYFAPVDSVAELLDGEPAQTTNGRVVTANRMGCHSAARLVSSVLPIYQ